MKTGRAGSGLCLGSSAGLSGGGSTASFAVPGIGADLVSTLWLGRPALVHPRYQ
jgi:hypothetical protein